MTAKLQMWWIPRFRPPERIGPEMAWHELLSALAIRRSLQQPLPTFILPAGQRPRPHAADYCASYRPIAHAQRSCSCFTGEGA